MFMNCEMWIMLLQTQAFYHCEAQLSIFEDNAAEIKMIMKGRRPTMRYVSRPTESRSCLFDKIHFYTQDPNRTSSHQKNKLADMLTNGSFTRDEWDQFLRLFNIMNFSMFLAAIFFGTQSRVSCRRDLKKDRRRTTCGKKKARPACLVSRNLLSAKQTTSIDSGASYGPRKQELGQTSVSGSTGKFTRDCSQNPKTRILKSDKKMTIRFGARGNLRDSSRSNLEGQGVSATVLKSQILCSSRKS